MKISRALPGYLGAVALVAVATLLCGAVRTSIAPANMVMLYLFAVVLTAARLGLRPAILSAVLSVLAFDFLFVPPRFSLRVLDPEYLITFFALFVVGVIISSLVAQIRDKVDQVERQEARTSSLYYLTRDLSAAADVPAVVGALQQAVRRNLGSRLAVVLDHENELQTVDSSTTLPLDDSSVEIAAWVMKSGRCAGKGTAAYSDSSFLFVPIKTGRQTVGAMVIEEGETSLAENLQLVEAFSGQAAMALERVYLSHQAEEARILRQKNHLEQALLNSISHDLRTPLVTISGVLDLLLNNDERYGTEERRAMLAAASEEAGRLNRFVGSLLDMTRLEAGVLTPRLAACEMEEIVGCAVGGVEQRLGNHRIVTSLEPDLPLVSADLALLTQALVNVLDNAIKHSPEDADILLSARLDGTSVILSVCDSGPGVPGGEEERIFDKFHRVTVPEKTGGTGLGLSIAKGIIEAHGGKITVSNRPEGGLRVEVLLPAGEMISDRG
ncbi:DUF4118 domain-containing protein [Geobacter sp. AOG2]|uniref:DUF4118 domain-containing protein n=1 Tax=Geobacter sp. AOG2 TaxID=1566347 RepID=UPI001CC4785D|nr:DUF4118 domain-containing protein [Geobacter sp. AOG2]